MSAPTPRISENELWILQSVSLCFESPTARELQCLTGIKVGSIYAILNRMEDTKRVIRSSRLQSGRRGRLYSLTRRGQRALDADKSKRLEAMP